MEKETTTISKSNFTLFKLKKFPKFFSSSCITQDISNVIHHQKPSKTPLMEEKVQHEEEDEEEDENQPFSYPIIRPKYQTPLLTCKPRCPESFDQMVRESCLIPAAGNPFPRQKMAGKYSVLCPLSDFSGRRCPLVSAATPLFLREPARKTKKKKKKKKKKNNNNNQRSKNGGLSDKFMKTNFKNHNPFSFPSSNETDWFSSDDEREDEEQETGTLFSSSNSKTFSLSSKSISLSSDSESHNQTRARHRRRRSESKAGPSRVKKEMEAVPLQGKVKDTFAVVKSSSDPYHDFRTSMVEMIIEKQIFGERELEQLLKCFLSLNSPHHHRVIVEVFTEIWDALFSYRS